ncbi:MAG: NUDIX hydrolase [Alphaproteobacteria bacterium]|nr:NUDIX hydrolase [Alphaproteobacteria bacterium]TAD89453.1 MAG: NUDIX hydrolase [Alphaproteobacteria bacterium]
MRDPGVAVLPPLPGDDPQPWRVAHSRTVHQDQWIHLRADACDTAAGHRIEPFYVLDYADWVTIVALTPDDEVVLVREHRQGAGGVIWGLPGGVMDAGEQDGAATARRELEEETGYLCGPIQPLLTTWANPATHTNRVHAYLATGATLAGHRQLHPGEEVATVLWPLARVVAAVLAGRMTVSSSHAATLLAAAAIRSSGEERA